MRLGRAQRRPPDQPGPSRAAAGGREAGRARTGTLRHRVAAAAIRGTEAARPARTVAAAGGREAGRAHAQGRS